MGPMLRKINNTANRRSKTCLTAQKKSEVNKCRPRQNENKVTGGPAVKIKTLNLTESQKCLVQSNTRSRSNRTVLGNKTNEPPAARNYMALRTRRNITYDSGLESSSSSSLADISYDSKVIRSPRSNKSNKRYSIKNVNVCQTPMKDALVLLENIDELLEKDAQTSSNPSSSQQKTCIYENMKDTNVNFKSVGSMLPEEKLALYEFEVDENEPKRVKKKRKRKPRIKKPLDSSESDGCPFMSVVKQMRHLTTDNRLGGKLVTNAFPTILPVCKRNVGLQDSQVSKQLPCVGLPVVNVAKPAQKITSLKTPASVNMCLPISPIERYGNMQIPHSPKNVRFANNPSANSTPCTPDSFQKTGKTSVLQSEGTPTFKINTQRNRGVSSIYIRPNSNVHHKFILDESICSENEEPTQVSPKTPPNVQELQPVLRQKRSRTTSMQHFFSPDNEPNCSNNSTKTNLDASGLFDDDLHESPKHEPQPSSNSSLSYPSFVTNRKKYQLNHLNNNSSNYSSRFFNDTSDSHRKSSQRPNELSMTFDDHVTVRKKYRYVPRISSFESRSSMPECGKELTLENCFGFDDESEDETTASLVTVATTSKLKSKIPASSTPYHSNVLPTKPQPARILVPGLREILAPLVAKKPEYPRILPQATNQSLSPTLVQSSVSSFPAKPKSPPATRVRSHSNITSPSILFSESKILTPVSFSDDKPSEFFTKPARNSYRGSARRKRLHYNEDAEDEHETPEKKTKKKKREVKVKDVKLDLWLADVNSHFNEIEDMELCVE